MTQDEALTLLAEARKAMATAAEMPTAAEIELLYLSAIAAALVVIADTLTARGIAS